MPQADSIWTRLQSSSEFVLPKQGIMIGKISGMGLHSGLAIETTLDPKEQAFLYDHQIDGTPVLPGVMGIEAFATGGARAAARLVYRGRRGGELPRSV